MRTPITYYGGKQNMVNILLPMIPQHQAYIEPFAGGLALFFAKTPSEVECINDMNKEVINFYHVIKTQFEPLITEIEATLYSRASHADAKVVYNNPHLHSELKRGWAFFILSNQAFSGDFGGGWSSAKKDNREALAFTNNIKNLTIEYSNRLRNTNIECREALLVIKNRDYSGAFFYCDPPYYNAHMGHYGGYTAANFEQLLETLSGIKGKFLLSSYPCEILTAYCEKYGWQQKEVEKKISANMVIGEKQKSKIEVLTYNYELSGNKELF